MLERIAWEPSRSTRKLSSKSEWAPPVTIERHSFNYTYSFAEVLNKITENGGKIAELDEPKLTHVVIDKLDATRRVKLIERTSQ